MHARMRQCQAVFVEMRVAVEQPIEIERHDADTIVVSNGLKDGDVVVTAGVQTLVPGQKVRLLEAGAGS